MQEQCKKERERKLFYSVLFKELFINNTILIENYVIIASRVILIVLKLKGKF